MTSANLNSVTPNISSPLHVFKENLPKKPYASTDLQRLIITSRQQAITYPYIQPNDPFNQKWLVFDIDLGYQSFFACYDAILPDPNIIVQNPDNGNCHALYALKTAVWMKGTGNDKAENYVIAIKQAMTQKIGADFAYSGLICKNPLHKQWRTTIISTETYELDYLNDFVYIGKPSKSKTPEIALDSFGGRNNYLFNELRKFAYRAVRHYKKMESHDLFASWVQVLEQEANRINSTFSDYLPLSEVKHTVSSIAKWVWSNYNPCKKIKRDEARGLGLNLQDKQTLSALTTNDQRKQTTDFKIQLAVKRLRKSGDKVTVRAVADLAKIGKNTVDRHRHLLK